MPDASSNHLVKWLRAAGESTRLRLLVLCADRDLSVSDLATAVAQSEPRVSRHLKILSEAGLIERLRQGQWVHYRVTQAEPALGFVHSVLAQLNRNDDVLTRDRGRLAAASATAPADRTPAAESKLGRALRGFFEGTGARTPPQSALVVGVDHLEVLEATARTAGRCVAIAHSRRAAQAARSYAEREDFACEVLLAASGEVLSERDVAKAGESFEAIVLDRFRASGGALAAMLNTAKRALAPGGKLWLFERYESLETPRDRVVEHPIARVRRLLTEAGLACERLSPIEADGEHVLAAVAALRAQAPSSTSVA
ncbi:MAG TPA: metalloregulator ArsR/SmtB family transcription factor [Steroidobacteraceae bacterium]|jgi:ArsR family transcriptional regulator|nr:metalloregulator ArsR/SmtB family transcription factor [Steroidobacteraceae bacterium]